MKMRGNKNMLSYIAIGEEGDNKTFRTQAEAKAHFELSQNKFFEAVEKGTPVEDPDNGKMYFLDELKEPVKEADPVVIEHDESDFWD